MPEPIAAAAFLKAPEKLPEAPVYAVFGPESWLRRRCLQGLCNVLRGRKFEVRRVEAADSVAPVLDELRSPGLFGGACALVLRSERQGNRHEEVSRFKEELLAYLDKPGRRNVLVFDGATFPRNLAVPKRVCERFPTVHCEELKPWDLSGWEALARLQAQDAGLELEPAALTALRDYTAASLGRAESELQKLALLVQGRRVNVSDIAQACGYEGQDVTFPLCDAVLTGDTTQALRHASKLAGKAEIGGVLSLLALLRNQVAALGRARHALAAGAGSADAVQRAGVRLRDAMRPAFVRTASALDKGSVGRAVDVLLAADEEMKTASPDPGMLLVSVVSRLCETLHRPRTTGQAGR